MSAARVAALLALAPVLAFAQARGRVDSTLPEAPRAGERVVETRPLRDAGEARLREELHRARELEALSLPPVQPWGGPVIVHPRSGPAVPCPGPGCPPGPRPPR